MGKIIGYAVLTLVTLATPAVFQAVKKSRARRKREAEREAEIERRAQSSDYLFRAAASAVYREQQQDKQLDAEQKIETAMRQAVGRETIRRAKKSKPNGGDDIEDGASKFTF